MDGYAATLLHPQSGRFGMDPSRIAEQQTQLAIREALARVRGTTCRKCPSKEWEGYRDGNLPGAGGARCAQCGEPEPQC